MPNLLPHSRSFRALAARLRRWPLLLLALGLLGPARARAQAINPRFFGINYWLPSQAATYRPALREADLQWVRIGGNEFNQSWTTPAQYDAAIEYARSIGAEPIVQVPIKLTPAQLDGFISHFNAQGHNISYWAIGNEADPANDPGTALNEPAAWSAGTYSFPASGGYTYSSWVAQYKLLAARLKTTAPASKLVGPDFRLFYSEIINDYYAKFLRDVGAAKVGPVPMLDYFAFHFYGDKPESELEARFGAVQTLIDAANQTRSNEGIGATPLRLALTEVNADASSANGQLKPWDFRAGQFVALMAKQVLRRSGLCVTPWSIAESTGTPETRTDFSLFNPDGSRRSTMHHLAMLSTYRRDNVMNGSQSGEADRVVFLGMRGQSGANAGYTVVLMNLQTATGYTYRASLDNLYHGTEQVRLKLEGYPGVTTQLSGTLPPRTTHLYSLDAQGKVLSHLVYSSADAAPVEQQAFHAVDRASGGYLRPLDGLATSNLVQDVAPDLTLSSLRWRLQPAAPGYYYLINQYTGRALRPTGSSAEYNLDGRPIGQVVLDATNRYENATMWQIQHSGDADYYWLRNRSSGKYLRPQNDSGADNAAVVQNHLDPARPSFKWQLPALGFVPAPVARAAGDAAPAPAAAAQVYPNPARDVLTVDTGADAAELTLRDLTGKLCRQARAGRHGQLELRGLPAGVYSLTIRSASGIQHCRLVKE